MITPKIQISSQMIAHHYDSLDCFYRQLWGEHLHHGYWKTGLETPNEAVIQLLELVASKVKMKKGERLCDIGSGYGASARWYADSWDAQVTALTLSEQQYEYARQLNPHKQNPRYLLQDWLENQLTEQTFDVAMSIESSEHMIDKEKFFQECHRVLVPGGRVIICAWLSKENPTKAEERYLLEPICREGCLPGLGTAKEYCLWLEQSGFENILFEDISKQVRKTWTLCIYRFVKEIFHDPKLSKALLDKNFRDRIFSKTLFRIWIAYYLGSMRYGLFTGTRPHTS